MLVRTVYVLHGGLLDSHGLNPNKHTDLELISLISKSSLHPFCLCLICGKSLPFLLYAVSGTSPFDYIRICRISKSRISSLLPFDVDYSFFSFLVPTSSGVLDQLHRSRLDSQG